MSVIDPNVKQIEEIHPKSDSIFRRLLRSKMSILGFLMLTSILLIAIFAPIISPYDPYAKIDSKTGDILASPSSEHLLGQDDAGRDVLSSVIYGSRISLIVGLSASSIIVILGATWGLLAGYFGGKFDLIFMRFVDVILVIPQLPLMLVIIAVAGRGIVNIILVIGFLSWTYMARVVRAQVLTIKTRAYILRVRSVGVNHLLIMFRHILPQVIPVIFAEGILDVSYAILTEATLSFLGLGDPNLISWGSILNRAFLGGAITRGAWWYLIPPGIALAWVTLALAFLGEGIQEIINTRLKTHHLFDERKIISLLKKFQE